MSPRKSRWSVRRTLANLLILGGICFLLYYPATWAYTWWQQRGLEQQLVETHPALSPERVYEYLDDLNSLQEEQGDLRDAAEQVRRERELDTFRRAASVFQAGLSGEGGEPIGRIIIQKIGVDVVLIEGTGRADLRDGPGHWPETPFPGMSGNFVVSGHRTTYGAPFFKLNDLVPGDEIDLALPYATTRYLVTRTVIVRPNETDVVAQRGIEEISLATCHPVYSAAQRLVVQAELVEFKLIEEQAPAAQGAAGSG
jgi:LPXTG-site transpeptidase (sortase) family protein